jgi:hypothetical protein
VTVAAKSYRPLRAILNTALKEDQLIAQIRAESPAMTRRQAPSGQSPPSGKSSPYRNLSRGGMQHWCCLQHSRGFGG